MSWQVLQILLEVYLTVTLIIILCSIHYGGLHRLHIWSYDILIVDCNFSQAHSALALSSQTQSGSYTTSQHALEGISGIQSHIIFLSTDAVQGISNSLLAFASMACKPSGACLVALVAQAETLASTFNSQQCANTLWALAVLNQIPVKLFKTLLDRLQIVLKAQLDTGRSNSRNFGTVHMATMATIL